MYSAWCFFYSNLVHLTLRAILKCKLFPSNTISPLSIKYSIQYLVELEGREKF
jgi:hypothetical protein